MSFIPRQSEGREIGMKGTRVTLGALACSRWRGTCQQLGYRLPVYSLSTAQKGRATLEGSSQLACLN